MTKTVQTIREDLKREVIVDVRKYIDSKISETAGRISSLEMDVENLKEEVEKQDDTVAEMKTILVNQQQRINKALEKANRNEQYSRKYNVRIRGLPEEKGENLRVVLPTRIMAASGVKLNGYYDIVAVHRLPSARGTNSLRPVIVKFFNNDIKMLVTKNKHLLRKAGLFVTEDITSENISLMDKVKASDKIEYSWYYNCNVYGLCKDTKRRVRFGLFDNIDSVIAEHTQNAKVISDTYIGQKTVRD
ncbi:uncharacterized protein [Argopecten irradians]|uniref:uncharacterized protein n=1 Tax=Argopecten irradians TaxID=31199 RepID=UPI0037232F1F